MPLRRFVSEGRTRGRLAPARGRDVIREDIDATHHAAVPRRSRRQPAAPAGAEGGARQARQGRDHGRAAPAVEDREIEKIIKKQEEVGLKLATDGEFRRSWWQFDFFKGLDGVELYSTGKGIVFAGVETKAESVRTVGKIGFSGHPHIDRFQVRQGAHAGHAEDDHSGARRAALPPGPRVDQQGASIPTSTPFFHDLAEAYRKAVRAFYDAGCRYLQLDDTTWSMMCDKREREHSRERGDDPETLPEIYARMINHAIKDRPADMTSPCTPAAAISARPGSRRAATSRSPSVLFNETPLDGYFLEYDSDRAGGFEPLRFFPKGKKQLVLGLVTSKSGTLEKQGRHQAADRRGDQICRARSALPVAAMRLRLDRGRQRAGRGRAMGEAADDRRTGGRGVGEVIATHSASSARRRGPIAPRPSRGLWLWIPARAPFGRLAGTTASVAWHHG